MIEVKRNCSSSIKDNGDYLTFGDFTIKFTGDHYIMFMSYANVTQQEKQSALASLIIKGLEDSI